MDTTLASQPVQAAACTLRRSLVIFIGAILMFWVACERSGTISDADAEQEVNYQRARRLCEQQDFPGAAEFYNKALSVNPEFANAHLELGLLYENRLADPISAIYHYRRFLELRPDSDKKQLAEDFIERAKLSLAAKLPQSPIVDPSELTRLENEKTALLQENAALRTRVAELEKAGTATQLVATGPTTVTVASTAPPVPAAVTAPAVAPGIVMAAAPIMSTSRGIDHGIAAGPYVYCPATRHIAVAGVEVLRDARGVGENFSGESERFTEQRSVEGWAAIGNPLTGKESGVGRVGYVE